jgi:hypothetical protein
MQAYQFSNFLPASLTNRKSIFGLAVVFCLTLLSAHPLLSNLLQKRGLLASARVSNLFQL